MLFSQVAPCAESVPEMYAIWPAPILNSPPHTASVGRQKILIGPLYPRTFAPLNGSPNVRMPCPRQSCLVFSPWGKGRTLTRALTFGLAYATAMRATMAPCE